MYINNYIDDIKEIKKKFKTSLKYLKYIESLKDKEDTNKIPENLSCFLNKLKYTKDYNLKYYLEQIAYLKNDINFNFLKRLKTENCPNLSIVIMFNEIPERWIWKQEKILPSICNEWEQEFMISIYNRYRKQTNRTPKQNTIIKKLQRKSRLDKIPDKIPEQVELKKKLNINNPTHKESVKIIVELVEGCGKDWDSYTKSEQKFIEVISVKIQKSGTKLNEEEIKKIEKIYNKDRNYWFDRFINRQLREWITKELTGSSNNTLKIVAVKEMRILSILCDIVNIKKYNKELMFNKWIPIRQIF
ncbi:hypothetical protein LCGC14_1260850 [marine sediment metagenome]|uniref:Uncharacterized protein n=1 Tax=marine sediment metagenome TaxID=412755 RepID=A0A0F9NHE2_9ZZZZ